MTDPHVVPSRQVAMGIAEPALRPAARRRPALDVVRHARIHRDGRDLVIRSPRGTERRHPIGTGGIRRAVHIDLLGLDAAQKMGLPVKGRWGMVDLQDEDGHTVCRIPLAEWLPESGMLEPDPLRGEKLLGRTGLAGLLKEAGIPVHRIHELDDPLLAGSSGGDKDVHFYTALPVWHSVARGTGMFLWFVTFFLGLILRDSAPWLLAVSGIGLLSLPVATAVLRLRARAKERGDDLAVLARLSPCPPSGAGATARFCATAAVRVQSADIVLVDSLAGERWLPRSGPHSVDRVVRFLSAADGTPLGVELQGSGGQVRAALPWEWWFGGAEGDARWAEFTAAVGRPVDDRPLGKGKRWPQDALARVESRLMAPIDTKEARRVTSFHGGVVGDASGFLLPLFSLVTLGAGLVEASSHPASGWLTGVSGALAFCGTAGPEIAHSLHSRLRLDRPAPGQAPGQGPETTSRQEPRS
ncbi:hypothetical protein [Streptomyces sp. H39-S7]|uniref:hypothetical protein n=1 Tax=Streptomyces sp. H39-S7 TaxID=3004357 RepID=UPI0022AF8BFF|nr:hypothetical protein [Streptomyces sp. H39-S7]MCZ4121385.1 hypothetical protein [Streptomyces sp. H39-S7]